MGKIILQGMLTEAEMLKLLNIKPSELSNLRLAKELPFVKISSRSRVYIEKSVLRWLESHEIILNRASKFETVE